MEELSKATVELPGRTDLKAFFELSGIIAHDRLPHTPFVVFRVVGTCVNVVLEFSAQELVERHPDDTPVMIQWPGRWRSDYFKMTVGDVRTAMQERGLLPQEQKEMARCVKCLREADPKEIGAYCMQRAIVMRNGLDRVQPACDGRIMASLEKQASD